MKREERNWREKSMWKKEERKDVKETTKIESHERV